jgi:hypothetical protein
MKKSLKVFALFSLFSFLSVTTGFQSVYAADNHKPVFTWKVLGGSVTPEQWIYDGDTPIAMFENRTVEQPGLQLMFFNRSAKPLALRHLKLTPDGKPLIEYVHLYDKFDPICTDKLVGLTVTGQNTDKLTVKFVSEDAFKVATSTRVLTLTYDNARGTYIYDIDGNLKLNSPYFVNGASFGFEYCDPWFVGCPGPAVEFPGMWDRRYQYFLTEDADGSVKKYPINHYITSYKGGFKFKPDGLFVTAYEPDGNPAIQFVGQTADVSSMGICWWGYDYHMSRGVSFDGIFTPMPFHFRFFQCPDSYVKDLMSKSVTPPLADNEKQPFDEYPIYERKGSFDKGLKLNEVYKGKTDPFWWSLIGKGGIWDKTTGRTDKFSLKISKTETGVSKWQTTQGDGEGYFTEPWTPCNGYKVSCWVKTDGVTGRGSAVAIQYHVPNSAQRYPVIASKTITGTSGWTKLEVEVGSPAPYPPEVGALMIMLQQDGAGTTWFDDLEVSPIK